MSKVGGKGFRAGGAWRADGITASGDDVAGILPRAAKNEAANVRAAADRVDYLNPEMWSFANGPMLRRYLVMAANRIAELERKLEEAWQMVPCDKLQGAGLKELKR